MTKGQRRYLCSGCRQTTKLLDRDDPDIIRTGCDSRGAIMRFVAYGTVAFSTQIRPREVAR